MDLLTKASISPYLIGKIKEATKNLSQEFKDKHPTILMEKDSQGYKCRGEFPVDRKGIACDRDDAGSSIRFRMINLLYGS